METETKMRASYARTQLFFALMCCIAVACHIYFTYCFYTLPEMSGMDKAHLNALQVMNYGVTLFFAAFGVLLFRFSKDPLSPHALLVMYSFSAVIFGRLIVEFIYPVGLPLSPVFPEHTSLVFKFLLSLILVVLLFKEIYRRIKLK